ncbi:MAG TPA: ribonuclease R, partial [Gemmatimonadota bacterium]|nr:ribonuclease R [Gemmatimonadota bacterium]
MTPSDLESRILEHLRQRASRPLKAKELARELDVPNEAYREFRETLRGLEESGLVYRQRKGRYAVPEKINLAIGRLQITRGGDGFVLVEREGAEDVFIPERHLGSAVESDIVVARIESRPAHRNPQGRILRVHERAWKQIVGSYRAKKNYGFVTTQEPDLRKDVFIPPDRDGGAKSGEMVLVEIEDWGDEEPNPVGSVVRVLGAPDEPGVDILAIIHGHQLPLDFPDGVTREAVEIGDRGLTEEDLAGREDLRDLLVFTIDPPDARDHDDALSVAVLEDGMMEVGVHIADVSHYVRPGTRLDEEALERGTSVYLVDRVVPMLPHDLSSDLCSLVPDEDRLAMSLLFRLRPPAEVRSARLVRSVIRSDHRLAYQDAQDILDGSTRGVPGGLVDAVEKLRDVSHHLRQDRTARGSIDFDLPESRVVLNAAGEPTDIERVLRLDAHRLIEDFMILANETVAELALGEKLPILFRVHESPDEEKVNRLRELASTFGFRLPARSVEPRDLARLVDAMDGTPQEQLISTATLRSMKQARYAADNAGHFGLASKAYAHFTSPIRRYPDLLVHRQLGRWLDDPRRARDVDGDRLAEVARHCSERERRAVDAERDSVDLKKIEFMERHLGGEFEGTISGVTAFGFFVLLDEFHVEGLVHVSTLEDDYYVFVEEQHALLGQRKRRRFQLGDRVRVQVARVDREARQIDFELLGT